MRDFKYYSWYNDKYYKHLGVFMYFNSLKSVFTSENREKMFAALADADDPNYLSFANGLINFYPFGTDETKLPLEDTTFLSRNAEGELVVKFEKRGLHNIFPFYPRKHSADYDPNNTYFANALGDLDIPRGGNVGDVDLLGHGQRVGGDDDGGQVDRRAGR